MAGETANTGAPTGQAPGDAQPPAGTTAGGQEPQAGSGQAPAAGAQQQPSTESPDDRAARLERELGEARKEAASYRTKASALERAQAEAAQAGMTEAERTAAKQAELERANTELLGQLREQGVRTAAVEAATKLGYRSPDVAYRLLNRAELEFNDAGQPKNVERLLRELLQAEPYLGKAAGADYGGGQRGTTPSGAPDMNELLRAAIKGN